MRKSYLKKHRPILYNQLLMLSLIHIYGYSGLINGDYREMNEDDFRGILTLGGTILGTKRTPFKLMRVCLLYTSRCL